MIHALVMDDEFVTWRMIKFGQVISTVATERCVVGETL